MQFSTISTYFTDVIADLKVTNIVLTTYTLDVPFFELEVVPLLFSKNYNFSNDERIKEIQVREALEESQIGIDVFYDRRMLQQDAESSTRTFPMMEYGFHGVEHDNGAFHSKMMFVLGENKSNEKELYIFSGSNNLTKAGWCDNIETISHIRLSNKQLPTKHLKEQFERAVTYLAGQIPDFDGEHKTSLSEIQVYLAELGTSEETYSEYFFFFNDGKNNFPAFIKKSLLGLSYITTQIVSPYFPDDDKSTLFKEINADECQLHLPLHKDQERYTAECTKAYFEHINESGIEWCQFKNNIQTAVDKSEARVLHAKIFIFETGNSASWSFLGSVNFTYKAFHDNVEAGFLFKNSKSPVLLEKLGSKNIEFKQKVELLHPGEEGDNKFEILNISLMFDWHPENESLSVNAPDSVGKTLYLQDGTGNILFTLDCSAATFTKTENLQKLRDHLEKNSYVTIKSEDYLEKVYVQQYHWQYKPLNYPDLTPYEIIKIYTYMNPQKREQYIMSALIRKLIQEDDATEYTNSIEEVALTKDFFSEYAELFYAFRQLSKMIAERPESKSYYLYAERPDALPALVAQVQDADIDNILKYLILLSSKELYKKYGSSNKEVNRAIKEVKKSFEDKKFIKWFEEEFQKNYKRVTHEE